MLPEGYKFYLEEFDSGVVDAYILFNGLLVSGAYIAPDMSIPNCISSLRTYPEHRRKGLASFILNKLIEFARNNNYDCLWLECYEDMELFYNKFDFLTEDVRHGHLFMKLDLLKPVKEHIRVCITQS